MIKFCSQIVYGKCESEITLNGWNGPSGERMSVGAMQNLPPRQCLVCSDVADVSCNRALFFRPFDNPTGTRMRCEWTASLG